MISRRTDVSSSLSLLTVDVVGAAVPRRWIVENNDIARRGGEKESTTSTTVPT